MAVKRYLVVCAAAVAIILAGCGTKQETTDVGTPTVRSLGVKLADVTADSATLLFDVEVDNPYPDALPLRSLQYSLTSGANVFISSNPDLKTTVPAKSKQVVSLPAKINYGELLTSLDGKPGTNLSYKAEIRLTVDAPRVGLLKIPVKSEGSLALPPNPAQAAEPAVSDTVTRTPDVIFVPTPQEVVDKMLELTNVTKDDILYDLGCGDGRIPVTAAKKYGCKAWGFDIDPQRIKESLENVEKNNIGNLVTIEHKDIFTLDLSKANVVTLYLLPSLNVKLIPQLEKLRPGSRIVSHDFDMEGVQPDKVVRLTSDDNNFEHTVYLWTTPLKKIYAGQEQPAPVEVTEKIKP
jgi:LEA14-like dessication related protein/precorrin-6B methylase 2